MIYGEDDSSNWTYSKGINEYCLDQFGLEYINTKQESSIIRSIIREIKLKKLGIK